MESFIRKAITALLLAVILPSVSAAGTGHGGGDPVAEAKAEVSGLPVDKLLKRLDSVVANHEVYRKRREEKIMNMKSALAVATRWEERFGLMKRLREEYEQYNNDSAIAWMQRCLAAAEAMGDAHSIRQSQCLMAYQYQRAGFNAEAIFMLDSVEAAPHDDVLADYYRAKSGLFSLLSYDTRNARDKRTFDALKKEFSDKLLAVTPKNSDVYFLTLYDRAGDDRARLALCNRWLRRLKPGTHFYAVANFLRYDMLHHLGHDDTALRCLLLSAICDVETATYDETAIYNISRILNDRGDVNRAKTYMKYAYLAYTRYGGKTRDWAIRDMEDTNARYLQLINEKQHIIYVSLYAILALFVLALILLAYSLRQHRKTKARNREIKQMNMQLSDTNEQLTRLFEQNRTMNSRLAEANIIKENYIGTFFGICSSFIDQSDRVHKKLKKLLRAKQYDEIAATLRSDEMEEIARDRLFEQFDTIFLNIFPNFTSDFNALLSPDSRVAARDRSKLTMGLRVFALIRLGVDDSQKIATFLGLANSTVYNYRVKYRNEALGDRATFEDRVKRL